MLPFPASTMARPRSPTTNCNRHVMRPHPLFVSSGRPSPACLASSTPPLLVKSSASSTPRTTLSTPLLFSSCPLPPAHRAATSPPPRHCVVLLPPPALFEPSPAGSCMPSARGHHHHHCQHNILLANERKCPSSQRKPRRLPQPWRLFWREERCWDSPPPRRCRRHAATACDPREGGGEGGTGKPSS